MRKPESIHLLSVISVVLLVIITISGIFSWDTSCSYETVNQYGETVKMWGCGIYAQDTYFKAPISIGSDITILAVTIPMTVYFIVYDMRKHNKKSRLLLVSVLAWIVYYAVSLCFGVTYNMLFLVYTALFSCSLFAFVKGIHEVSTMNYNVHDFLAGKAYTIFLILSGISTMIAWLPDIISSFSKGHLELAGVYTTEITYVLDMGIISPVAFLCLYLIKKRHSFGAVLLSVLTLGITVVGIMMIFQTGFQIASGIDIPLQALITKSLIFLVLGIYAFVLIKKFYKNMED